MTTALSNDHDATRLDSHSSSAPRFQIIADQNRYECRPRLAAKLALEPGDPVYQYARLLRSKE